MGLALSSCLSAGIGIGTGGIHGGVGMYFLKIGGKIYEKNIYYSDDFICYYCL